MPDGRIRVPDGSGGWEWPSWGMGGMKLPEGSVDLGGGRFQLPDGTIRLALPEVLLELEAKGITLAQVCVLAMHGCALHVGVFGMCPL